MSYTGTRNGYTAPNPYDQVFVLSQGLINDSFAFLHDHADPSTPMVHFYKKIREEYIDMYLGASTIQLQAIGIDPQLYFTLHVSAGELAVFTDDESEDTTKFPLEGWVLAYPVKLSSAVIPANDPLYSKKGIDPSVFSLTQLFLSSSSSTTLSEELSSYGNSGIKNNPYAYAAFKTFLSKWLEFMQANNQTILGYGKTVTPTGADKTTYPPTSLDYYIYPWKGPTSGDPIKNNLDKNCLAYLMMSDWRTPPAPIGLPYSGPFTDGTAAYCMNTTTFWDTWLIPILKQYNSGSEVVPLTSVPYYSDPYWYCPLSLKVGGNPDHGPTDSYYNFSKAGPSSWTWSGRTLSSQGSGSSGGATVTDYETSTSSTTLSFEQGGNTVSVNGVNVFTFSQSYNNESNPSKITYTTNWSLKLKINSVKDGGIEMSNDPGSQTTQTTYVVNHVGNLYFVDPESAKANFSNSLSSWLSSATRSVQNAVVNALDNQNKLVLPAAGTFDMINPLFNNRGDLLVDLWYDGTHDTDPGGGGKSFDYAKRFLGRSTSHKTLLRSFDDEEVRNGGPEKVLEILEGRPDRIGQLEDIPYTPEPITWEHQAAVRQ